MRTEEEVLKDFRNLELKIHKHSEGILSLENTKELKHIIIYKKERVYKVFYTPMTLEEHKLLNELFSIWGWL